MQIFETEIAAVKRVIPKRHGDDRGWFSEVYRADLLAKHGIANAFVQDNQSFSAPAGTIRGLHFQVAPNAQAKLVRVLAGAILDVAVDLRSDSPSYGRHVAVRLDATGGEQLFVPAGFAHGFCTLEPDTMVAYKVDAYYSPADDRNLRWNDPAIGIAWPVAGGRSGCDPLRQGQGRAASGRSRAGVLSQGIEIIRSGGLNPTSGWRRRGRAWPLPIPRMPTPRTGIGRSWDRCAFL